MIDVGRFSAAPGRGKALIAAGGGINRSSNILAADSHIISYAPSALQARPVDQSRSVSITPKWPASSFCHELRLQPVPGDRRFMAASASSTDRHGKRSGGTVVAEGGGMKVGVAPGTAVVPAAGVAWGRGTVTSPWPSTTPMPPSC